MRARLNIRQTKALIWVCCALLFAWDGWTFVDIYKKKQAKRYTARPAEVYGSLLSDGAGQVPTVERGAVLPDRTQYETLWTALVNGEDPVPPQADPAEAAGKRPEGPAPLKPIADVLDVGLIFYSSDPASRFVAVNYKDQASGAAASTGKLRRLHLSEGELLSPPYDGEPYNGRVVEIRRQEVVIHWGEDDEVLNPGLGREGSGVPLDQWDPEPQMDPFAEYARPPVESVYLQEGEWLLGTQDRDEIARDPHAYMQEQVRVRTITPKQGERSMIELAAVEEGSVAYRLGARSGDRIISVNGIPMTSMSSAINWFHANPDLKRYVVRYERAGQEKTLTFNVK